jgi:hypothetical protein
LALCAAGLEGCALSPVVVRNVPDIFAMRELETTVLSASLCCQDELIRTILAKRRPGDRQDAPTSLQPVQSTEPYY